jgi:pyruvate dehydrogenase E2 component (dihydrolipoamide acetyltransferase)
MPEVGMPRLSDSMEEGTIARWLRAEGDVVSRGEEIVEIETDKATMGYAADHDGVLSILVEDGQTVPVGAPIALIGEPAGADEPEAVVAGRFPLAPAGVPGSSAVADPPEAGASPVATRMARRLGIMLDGLAGTGPRGRILKRDVVAAGANGTGTTPATAAHAARTAVPTSARDGIEPVTLSRLQATVARRMTEATATVPDFWVSVDADMSGVIALREDLRQLADPLPSINDVLVKAAAATLRSHPRVNGSYRDGSFELHRRINVGIAVAAPDGLVVPTVFDADSRSLTSVAADTRALAARVRDGSITPAELAGATFTISNLGMFGVARFAGIVNPPQAAILCAGAVEDRVQPLADGTIGIAPMMTLTLVSDHRIVYGADAAAFLSDLRRLLERPLAAVV